MSLTKVSYEMINGAPVNVLDYGAIGDGVTNDTAAITAAIAATPINGAVYFPYNTYLINSNIDASDRILLLYGDLTGTGSIIGDNVVRLVYGAVPSVIPSVYGAGFKASTQDIGEATSQHIGESHFTSAIIKNTVGSGANGPANADGALFITTKKDDWLTSNEVGEIDGQYIVVRQGQESDTGGLLIDMRKVRGSTGGAVAIECANEWVDSSELRLMRIQTIKNFTEGAGGHSGNTGYGFYAEAQAGNPFAAYYAGGLNDGGANSPGTFQNLIVLYSDRLSAGGVLVYKVDGNGRTQAPNGTAANPSYSFHADPDTGIVRQTTNAVGFVTGGVIRWVVEAVGNLTPNGDNLFSLGNASFRTSVIYSATPTINTSDEREKQDFEEFNDAEKRVAQKIKTLIKKFKFKDAVQKKGNDARIHVGVVAQEVKAAFISEGLNPNHYALFCYDEWDDKYDEEGKLIHAAGNRYGVRYEELLSFVISAL